MCIESWTQVPLPIFYSRPSLGGMVACSGAFLQEEEEGAVAQL